MAYGFSWWQLNAIKNAVICDKNYNSDYYKEIKADSENWAQIKIIIGKGCSNCASCEEWAHYSNEPHFIYKDAKLPTFYTPKQYTKIVKTLTNKKNQYIKAVKELNATIKTMGLPLKQLNCYEID